VNSFSNKVEASGYVSQLRKMGYKAFLVATYSKERGALYRVRLGPFLSKNEAEKYRKKFEEQEGVPTYVVKRVLEEG
jgi:cell division septation protein DedD